MMCSVMKCGYIKLMYDYLRYISIWADQRVKVCNIAGYNYQVITLKVKSAELSLQGTVNMTLQKP